MFQIGSKLLGLTNNHDDDFLVIVENETKDFYKRSFIDGKDIVSRSFANINSLMNFEYPLSRKTIMWYINLYQYDKDIIGQDFPIEYHILDKKKKYVELLNYIVDNQELNFNKNLTSLNKGHLSKILYHVAYLTFIMENNSTTLSAEQKAIVQKIHDKQMPVAYLDELEEKIRNLKSSKE